MRNQIAPGVLILRFNTNAAALLARQLAGRERRSLRNGTGGRRNGGSLSARSPGMNLFRYSASRTRA